jgi:hypothetical protein
LYYSLKQEPNQNWAYTSNNATVLFGFKKLYLF